MIRIRLKMVAMTLPEAEGQDPRKIRTLFSVPLSELLPEARPEAPGAVELALVAYAGQRLGEIFHLEAGENLVGRSGEAGISIQDEQLSRRHCRLELAKAEDGQQALFLDDLDSTNGTILNGEAVKGRIRLAPGDRLAAGEQVFKVVALDALERAFYEKLTAQTVKDPLTGLATRAFVLEALRTAFAANRRYAHPLSLILCGLDRLGAINEAHGQAAGDRVLRDFGRLLLGSLRESDVAGRVGGGQFLMILPETELAGAMNFAERLRETQGRLRQIFPHGEAKVTCTLGVAVYRKDDPDAGALLERADRLLADAKAAGRNRVAAE